MSTQRQAQIGPGALIHTAEAHQRWGTSGTASIEQSYLGAGQCSITCLAILDIGHIVACSIVCPIVGHETPICTTIWMFMV